MLKGKDGIITKTKRENLLVYCDKNLVCKFANEACIQWFGIKPLDLIHKISLKDLLKKDFEKAGSYIKEVLRGKIQVFELQLINSAQLIKQTIITFRPDFDNGIVIGFNIYMADISLIKKQTIKPTFYNEHTSFLSSAEKSLKAVTDTLGNSLMTEFPGIESLAKIGLVSTSKLKRDFKVKHGKTIFAYYRHLQMELAHGYLKEKTYSKKQLAAIFNFSNPSNFSSCYNKFRPETLKEPVKKEIKIIDVSVYRSFIKDSPSSIAMFDNSMCYLMASQKWVDFYNVNHKDVLGKHIFELIPNLDTKWNATFKECLQGKTKHGYEKIINKDGSMFLMRWNVRPWYKQKDVVSGLLVLMEDITSLKLEMPRRLI